VNSLHYTTQNASEKTASKSARLNQLVRQGENVIKIVVSDAELSEKRKKGGVRHFSTELKVGNVDMQARKVLNEKTVFNYSLTEYFEFVKEDCSQVLYATSSGPSERFSTTLKELISTS